MIKLRKSEERGQVNHGWLKAKHSFSFASYQDPKHKHFGPLRVINQDIIAGDTGFPEHPHDNMEIITYIISGEMSHKDSTGGGSTIFPGKIQRMSAGSGISHSEFNSSSNETELLQIWLFPEKKDIEPSYEEKEFSETVNNLQLLVSQKGESASLHINRDIKLYRSFLKAEKNINFKPERKQQWIQLVSGSLLVNDIELKDGDGLGLKDFEEISIQASKDAHFLLFDMN